MTGDAVSERRRPGGRSARVVAAVHQATLEILAEVGYAGLQLTDVADRAGVNKTTVYRRWSTKAALIGDILTRFARTNVATPDTGSLRGDLELLLSGIVEALGDRAIRAVVEAAVMVDVAEDDVRRARAAFWDERFLRSGVIVERAVARGELPSTTDVREFLETAASPLYFRILMTDDVADAAYVAAVAERTVRAFAGV
ncbi:TetR/AcrR family transcriptional regulator [Gordonia sp. LUNF6]|uniref:TetR/AcrR family transcriptional regulator n=1 Tax=Gordonia TaxID=2053 RepID=UPI0024175BBF|nr:TetR/AcrR family transcriptional regulator [Gordonia sihwensis]WFN93257.1 TetR/AcrR family transcriptional regulator [Gordonia sihwensis]